MAEPAPVPVVVVDGITKSFQAGKRRVCAIDNLSAEIPAGRITGLVGPDGAGKTTLMRLIAGLLLPDSGRIRVAGFDTVEQAPDVQSAIGYMPQQFGLYEDLSVQENLDLYADLRGLAGAERKSRQDRLMGFTGLGPFRRRLAGRLSGGMKQKLGLACTLMQPPHLLLLDEPSAGVDPVSRRELWQIVTELVAEGIGVLWSTAYLDEAERCPEVLLLHEGRLLRRGDPTAMSARLAGRTFLVSVPPAQKRGALARLRGDDGVLDALIQGRHIRVLLAAGAGVTAIKALLGEGAREAEIRPVEPRLEDAFVAVLKETGESPGAPAAQVGKPRPAPVEPVSAAQARSGVGRAPQDHGATIEVHDLVRTFGPFRAVDGIGFEVARGEIFGLLGPNGAGKSTTFKMLLGLLAPSAGTARVMGIDLARASAVARGRIGYMPQKFSLYGNLGVAQNLSFFADAYGLWGRRKRARMDWVLDEFALAPVADAVSGTLPLGFKQRLSLGCALMHEPDVLFLDEPTSGVDPLIRREFWDRINAMAQTGVTIMVTTHFMDEAEYCDRVGIVYRGRLVATGSPDELKERQAEATGGEPTLEDVFVRLIETSDREMPP